jgi:hypothetical protein
MPKTDNETRDTVGFGNYEGSDNLLSLFNQWQDDEEGRPRERK